MNAPRDPDVVLAAWLDDGPEELPSSTRRAISTAVRTTPQARTGFGLPARRPMMSRFFILAGGAAVVAFAIGAVAIGMPRSSGGIGAPAQSPGPSPTSSPARSQSSSNPAATAPPSPFTSSQFKVPIGFTLLDGWTIATDETGTVGMQLSDAVASFVSLDSLTVRGATSTSPWQPWPDDIHAWMAARPEFRPDAARSGVVGGQPAVIVDATYVREKITDPGDWMKYGTGPSDGLNLKGSWPGRVRIVVVHTGPTSGVVVVMDAALDAFDDATASLDRVLATLTFK